MYVSRRAGGKGRAVLEGLGLDLYTIEACFRSNPLDEEEAVQAGLIRWKDGQGLPPTWSVLFEAMDYAGIGPQHIQSLKATLGLHGAYAFVLVCCMCVFVHEVCVHLLYRASRMLSDCCICTYCLKWHWKGKSLLHECCPVSNNKHTSQVLVYAILRLNSYRVKSVFLGRSEQELELRSQRVTRQIVMGPHTHTTSTSVHLVHRDVGQDPST